jgi:bacteriorhodopsin
MSSSSLNQWTGWFNRAAFPTSLAYISFADSDVFETIRNYEIIILGTASISYYLIQLGDTIPMSVQHFNTAIRFVDWFITTPFLALIVYEYARLTDPSQSIQEDFEAWWFALLPAIMVAAGYLVLLRPECETSRLFFLGISWLALFLLLYLIYELSTRVDLKGLDLFFYFGWIAYGLAFFIPDYYSRATVYNILDLINKVIFSLYITLIVF